MSSEQEWDNVFPENENVISKKVTFRNRYGITLAGNLYQPKSADTSLPALVISGPFGAVKEQASGFYAQSLAEKGYVTLAFDPSFTGESGGDVRDTASPEIFTEDFSAAVDFIGLLKIVDRERIGTLAICGLSGMAITAAASDPRIKAVATVSMYDMSRSMSRSFKDSYTQEQRHQVLKHLSLQRWRDAENGGFARGYHETPFNADGNIVTSDTLFPDNLPEDADPVVVSFYNYYCKPRGFHERSVNSTRAWTATTPMAFFSFPLMANLDLLSPRPVMLIAGENAHSLYYSQDVYDAATGPKELVIVPDADHVDLYDNAGKIPFDRLNEFFSKNLH